MKKFDIQYTGTKRPYHTQPFLVTALDEEVCCKAAHLIRIVLPLRQDNATLIDCRNVIVDCALSASNTRTATEFFTFLVFRLCLINALNDVKCPKSSFPRYSKMCAMMPILLN